MGAGAGYHAPFYRPLQTFTYLLDYSLWGLRVWGYHLTNTGIHILVALTIYFLVNLLIGNRTIAFFSGLLFVAHPLAVETVAFISDRSDSLAALFMLLCLFCYIKYLDLENAKAYVLISLTYLCALLSKENSIVLPALLLLYHYAFQKKTGFKKILSLSSILLLYIPFRAVILKSLLPDIPFSMGLPQRILGAFAAIADCLRLILFPFDLHVGYGYPPFHLTHPKVIAGAGIASLLLTVAFLKRKSSKLIFFSVGWFFIALLPVSNIFPINEYYLYERWLYFPSIGIFLLLAERIHFIYQIKKFRIFSIFLVIGLLAFYASLTVRQNRYWKEPITFYQRNLKYAPENWRFYHELGAEYMHTGKIPEAITLYQQALKINPNLSGTYYNLGNAYWAVRETSPAIASYRRALEIDPHYAEAYINLGNIYYSLGKNEEAAAAYHQALKINPLLSIARSNLKLLNYQQKDKEKYLQQK